MGEHEEWPTTAEAVFTGMADWRAAHPRATLREIEEELDAHLAALRARMLEDLALASAQRDVVALPEEARPQCPACGTRLEARGQKRRRLTTQHNRQITLTRSYAACPSAARGFFPLDEELALGRSCLTPQVQESLVRLGTLMSFGHAARELAHHVHVRISASTARRLTEGSGAAYEAVQTAQVEVIERDLPPAPAGPALQQISADGALVPLVGGTWAEVKTVALGTVVCRPPRTRRDREQSIHTDEISYFSRLADHETFTRLAVVETQRRGTETAGQVVAVSDGALWLQEFVATHRPDAVRILDWPHAVESLARVAKAVYGAETPAAQAWLARQRRRLLEEAPAPVLDTLRTLQAALDAATHAAEPLVWTVAPEGAAAGGQGLCGAAAAAGALPVVAESRGYLEARTDQMRYAAFRAAGYPIGSGMVESANKLLVEARLKGAGMRWARAHVNPLVALRTVAYADRWAEAWPQIVGQQRQHARAATRARQHARLQAPPSPPVVSATPAAPVPPLLRVEFSCGLAHGPTEEGWREGLRWR